MGRIIIPPSVKASPEVETALEGFKPVFGNETHIRILNTYGEIRNLIAIGLREDERRKELRNINSLGKARNRDIKMKESSLIWMLKQEKEKTI